LNLERRKNWNRAWGGNGGVVCFARRKNGRELS